METLRRRAREFLGGRSGLVNKIPRMSHHRLRRLFRTREMAAPLIAAAGFVLSILSASRAGATDLNGSAAIASDYVWRGTTQSQGDPAAQAGIKLAGKSGWYGSVWASSVEFAPETHASSEVDFVAGWSGGVSEEWALDANLTHYGYPSTSVDLDWTELVATATWRDNYWLQVGCSNEALAADESGTYAQVGAKLPLGDRFRIEAAAGHYWLEDVYGDSYSHAQLSGVWAFKAPFELRVTAHGTDASAKRLFPGLAGSRVEAALQASL
jgi:uncharacterized protein (TIGR02001 family)